MGKRHTIFIKTDPNSTALIGIPGHSIFIGSPGPTIYNQSPAVIDAGGAFIDFTSDYEFDLSHMNIALE